MKKIFKKFKLRDLIIFILGGLVIGGIGVTATSYVLGANEVKYTDPDGNVKDVQQAIEELYVLSQNSGKPLYKLSANGTPTSNQNQIVVNFNKIDPSIPPTITCKAVAEDGTIVNGTINNNTCRFSGLLPNTNYTYEVIRTDENGTTHSITGNKTTAPSGAMLVTENKPKGTLGIAYLDPTDLSKDCNADNSISTPGTRTGCMKWYVFKKDDKSYTMILDHNTYAKGTWEDSKSALATLKSQPGWKDLNTRMISAHEVADITENTNFTSSYGENWFYLDSNTHTRTATSLGASKYYWLFDYTSGCTSYGCNTADSSIDGYWTDTPLGNEHVWAINSYSSMDRYKASNTDYGLRPVITVPKSNF